MKTCLILTMFLWITGVAVSSAKLTPDNDRTVRKERIEPVATTTEQWQFYLTPTSPTAEELTAENDYLFGGMAGCLYNTFLKLYVAREEVVAGDPTRRNIIRKPVIYKAVRQIEKQLKKEVKAHQVSVDQATQRLEEVLRKAISAFDSDTASFEKALTTCDKDLSDLYAVFDRVKLIEL